MIVIRNLVRSSHQKVADRLSRLTSILKEMPKDPAAARELKQHRIAKAFERNALLRQPSGVVSLHVLGNGGPGNPASVMVVTEHCRYLFNCGEGTQRLAVEHGLKLAKLQHVFLTQCTWKHAGGLPGMSMTLQSIGIPELVVHAPSPIIDLYKLTRLFSVSDELNVSERTANDKLYTDPNLTLTYVTLSKSSASLPSNGDETEGSGDESGDKRNGKKMRMDNESGAGNNDLVMNYICKLPPLPGSLNIDKCIELKVPKGPALGQLKNGEDYVFPDGRIVKSTDVVDPYDPGPVFLIIDCPSLMFLDSLIASESIIHHQMATEEKDIPGFVFHFSPGEIVKNKRYQEWMDKFPASSIHVGVNEDNPNKAFAGASILQTKLRCLDDQIFHLPFCSVNDDVRPAASFVPAQTLLRMNIRPSNHGVKLDSREVVKDVVAEDCLKELAESPGAEDAIRDHKAKLDQITAAAGNAAAVSQKYPVITFLGTASAAPAKHRNTACIHVATDANSAIIFDCGEGSYGQLFRFFGPDQIESELKKIKAVFISHLHADHHLGLISLLQKRSLVTSDKAALFLPQAVHNWLHDYDRVFEKVVHLFSCKQNEILLSSENYDSQLMNSLNLSNLQTVRVKHCRDSFGITITTRDDPFKIVYSGDAMPSDYLAVAGRGCDVLIHEATMEDDLADEAVIKRHSTTSQAIEMGKKMNAKYTVLTHFSQRYSKIPMIDADAFEKSRVGCAFDNLQLRRFDYDRLVLMNRPLNICFSEVKAEQVKRIDRLKRREKVLKQFVLNE